MNKILNLMEEVPSILEWVKYQDTNAFGDFLKSTLEKPLICIGSGGSFSTCELIAMMYETLGGFAKAVTPYSVYSMSDNTLSRSKILLVSNSGHNEDIVRIAKYCMELTPLWTANLTTADGKNNNLKSIIPTNHSFNFASNIKDGFISVNSVFANYAIAIQSIKGIFDVATVYEESMPNLSEAKHFIILYGGWGNRLRLTLKVN